MSEDEGGGGLLGQGSRLRGNTTGNKTFGATSQTKLIEIIPSSLL